MTCVMPIQGIHISLRILYLYVVEQWRLIASTSLCLWEHKMCSSANIELKLYKN